jgi:rubrerythrin
MRLPLLKSSMKSALRSFSHNIEQGAVFKKGESVLWQCRNCGYVHEGKEAPETCPACAHPQDYFELLAENW